MKILFDKLKEYVINLPCVPVSPGEILSKLYELEEDFLWRSRVCRVDPEIICEKCNGRMFYNDWTIKDKIFWKCMNCGYEIIIKEVNDLQSK